MSSEAGQANEQAHTSSQVLDAGLTEPLQARTAVRRLGETVSLNYLSLNLVLRLSADTCNSRPNKTRSCVDHNHSKKRPDNRWDEIHIKHASPARQFFYHERSCPGAASLDVALCWPAGTLGIPRPRRPGLRQVGWTPSREQPDPCWFPGAPGRPFQLARRLPGASPSPWLAPRASRLDLAACRVHPGCEPCLLSENQERVRGKHRSIERSSSGML